MYPDDRVLVGVMKRKGDLQIAQEARWYRIPQSSMPRGVHAEYIAFFLSGRAFKEQSGGIHYFARRRGVELNYRHELLPDEANHKNADAVYYKVQLDALVLKNPPVLNTTKRVISFIHTTWDRFVNATQISDLYSKSDYYVDRIYHALRSQGVRPDRFWEAEKAQTGVGAQVRILCAKGVVVASPEQSDGGVFLDYDHTGEDKILAQIRAAIRQKGGLMSVSPPLDH
jgi:hypothetical protein